VSIGPTSAIHADGRSGRHLSSDPARRAAGRPNGRRLAAVLLALLAALLVAAPVASASPAAPAMPAPVVRDDTKDATDGGYVPNARQSVIPSVQVGLSRAQPIPLGVTCSCTIDRVGLTSQFDITVITVDQDAIAIVLQLNRFNRPPHPGFRYVAAYVGQQYVAGPQDQAYTTSEADWKATTTDDRLSDTAQLFHTDTDYRPRADVYPGNYVNGWLIYELAVDRPAFLVWNYNFVGERGVWFALQ
jgi:hypothetical protein